MNVLQLVIALTLSWLLAGVVVVVLLNIAKWQVHRSSGRRVLADTRSLAGIDARAGHREAAEISRAVARHPAAWTREQLATSAR
jgi:hypothetical protein